jgi:ATP-binding cassette subfamily C protein LapB
MRPIDFSKDMRRFRPMVWHIVAISILIGVMALAPTIYNMTLYDRIIVGGSGEAVWPLLFGAAMAFSAEWFFRVVRSRQMAAFGARMDHVIGSKIFKQLLGFPTAITERASVSAQIARLRDFDSVRDFFTGALAPLFFELPLTAVYLAVMAMISPVLVLVPLALVAC